MILIANWNVKPTVDEMTNDPPIVKVVTSMLKISPVNVRVNPVGMTIEHLPDGI